MECSPPGSSVHGSLQARILEWVAVSFSRESSWPRDWIQVSDTAGRFFTIWATREAHRDGCSVLWPLHIQWLSHPPSSSPQIPQSPWAPSSLKITWPPHLLFEHVLLPAPWNASFSGSFAVWDHVSSLANGPKTVYMNKWISCFLFVPQWLRQVRTMQMVQLSDVTLDNWVTVAKIPADLHSTRYISEEKKMYLKPVQFWSLFLQQQYLPYSD